VNATKFPHLSKDLIADLTSKFVGDVYLDSNCKVGSDVMIDGSYLRIIVGKDCIIGSNTIIKSQDQKIIIGDNVTIGESCKIYASVPNGATITDNTIIGIDS
jgi:carbonic anhydrase/acetyltransferase-like protein (isoleucine patch superfamily)